MPSHTDFRIGAIIALLGLANTTIAQASPIYVDKDLTSGLDNGSNWSNAYRGDKALQKALTAAGPNPTSVVEIWVAAGVYKPSNGFISVYRTFVLVDNVAIYGGFLPGDSQLTDRQYGCVGGTTENRPCSNDTECEGGGTCPTSRNTILNGDTGQVGWDGDNSNHVVTYSTVTPGAAPGVLDGFIIEKGYAAGTSSNSTDQGAAVHIRSSIRVCSGGCGTTTCTSDSNCPTGETCRPKMCLDGGPKIRNCLIRNNYASNHGAVNDHGQGTEISNCVFRDNIAGKGAGLLVEHGSTTISDSYFTNNLVIQDDVDEEGAALWLGHMESCSNYCNVEAGGASTVTNCLFENNGNGKIDSGTSLRGGAAWVGISAQPTFSGCRFKNNSAQLGAAVYDSGVGINKSVTFEECDFEKNSSVYYYGVLVSGANLTLDRCTFMGNNTVFFSPGGTVYGNKANITATNCVFIGNHAKGGAIYALGGNHVLTNCTIAHNYSRFANSGGVFIEGSGDSSSLTAKNCIFWGNRSSLYTIPTTCPPLYSTCPEYGTGGPNSQVYATGYPLPTLNVTYSIWEGNTSGGTIINSDPKFVTVASAGTPDCNDTASCIFGDYIPGSSPDESANDSPLGYGVLDELLSDSPAIDAGDNTAAIGTTDRKNCARRYSGSTVDIGAFEYDTCQAGCASCP